jgi:hypothetical protein
LVGTNSGILGILGDFDAPIMTTEELSERELDTCEAEDGEVEKRALALPLPPSLPSSRRGSMEAPGDPLNGADDETRDTTKVEENGEVSYDKGDSDGESTGGQAKPLSGLLFKAPSPQPWELVEPPPKPIEGNDFTGLQVKAAKWVSICIGCVFQRTDAEG